MIFDKPSQAIDVSEFATKEYVNQIVGAHTTGYTYSFDMKVPLFKGYYTTTLSQAYDLPVDFNVYKALISMPSINSYFGNGRDSTGKSSYPYTTNSFQEKEIIVNSTTLDLASGVKKLETWSPQFRMYFKLTERQLILYAYIVYNYYESGQYVYCGDFTVPVTLKLFA